VIGEYCQNGSSGSGPLFEEDDALTRRLMGL